MSFFREEVPSCLSLLNEDHKPLWGKMTPQHMIEHLIVTYKMSIGRIRIPVVTPEEDHPRLRAYLMRDSPMRRSVPSPTGKNELQPLRSASLDEAKEKLLAEVESFIAFEDEQPELTTTHPYGGPFNMSEWLQVHRKHIKHHFIQFGLIPDYERAVHHRRLEKMLQLAPINQNIFEGSKIMVSDGKAVLELDIHEKYFHAADAMHGAVYFKLLDDSAYFAAASMEETYFILTKSYEVKLKRPVQADHLTAEGWVEEMNDQEIIAASRITNRNGKVVAEGRGIFVRGPKRLVDLPGYAD